MSPRCPVVPAPGISAVTQLLTRTLRRSTVDTVAIAVLGPLTCDVDTSFGRRDRAVLTALAICLGRVVSPDQLADAVGASPRRPRHTRLSKVASSACARRWAWTPSRRPPGVIGSPSRQTRWTSGASSGWCRRPTSCWPSTSRSMRSTCSPRRWSSGGFGLRGGGGLGLALIEAGRLDELRLEAEELRVDAYLRVGRHMEVLATAESMVREAPMRERRWALLAVAQYRAGRQVEALRTVHRVSRSSARSSGLTWGRSWQPSRSSSFARTIHSSREAPSRPERNAPTGASRPTTWTTPSPSSAGTRGEACLAILRITVSWPWSAPRAAASRPSCGPAWRPPAGARAAGPRRDAGASPHGVDATQAVAGRGRCCWSTSARRSSRSATDPPARQAFSAVIESRPKGVRS